MWINWIAIVLASLVGVGTLVLSAGGNLLRDQSSANGPFSLARTQLLWWTDIIAICALVRFARTGTAPELNATCVCILGIGIATAAIGALIDARQHALGLRITAQGPASTRGFCRDILSGPAGLGVHRLQLVIFDVVLGVGFMVLHVEGGFALPAFGLHTLLLLAVSSAGYLLLKTLERGPLFNRNDGPRSCNSRCRGEH